MQLFKKRTKDDTTPIQGPPAIPMDLSRFERLLETSLRLRDSGVDYDAIQRRAAQDEISFQEALEAIDREGTHPASPDEERVDA
jgi:hypothetical protein